MKSFPSLSWLTQCARQTSHKEGYRPLFLTLLYVLGTFAVLFAVRRYNLLEKGSFWDEVLATGVLYLLPVAWYPFFRRRTR